MAVQWRPVGPESEQTYWVRRAVIAAAAVVVLVGLIALVVPGGGDDAVQTAARQAPSPTPAAVQGPQGPQGPTGLQGPSAPPSQAPEPSPSAAAACAPQQLRIAATVEKSSYPVGGRPRLTLTVTDTGAQPCRVDLGQRALELVVTSGSDRIWSSDDCAPGGPAQLTTLAPGKPHTTSVTWAGIRSRPGCAGDQAQARPGTYRVSGRVDDTRVEGDVFDLTG